MGLLTKETVVESEGSDVLKHFTYYSFGILYDFVFCLTFIFIHGGSDNKSSASCRSHLCSPPPLTFSFNLFLSVPHCRCREHSSGHRLVHGNTQQTRKMTASAISFSEGLQVRQEMAIIPSTLSVLSYFLL